MAPPPSSRKSIHPGKINTRSNDSVVRGGKKRYASMALEDDKKCRSTPPSESYSNFESESDERNDTVIDHPKSNKKYSNESDSDEFNDADEAHTNKKSSTAMSRQKINRRSHESEDDDEISWKTSYNSLEVKQAEMNKRISSMERKLLVLENKIENQTAASLLNRKSGMRLYKLSEWQVSRMSDNVRTHLFRTYKYFDKHCIKQDGTKIFNFCLRKAEMTGEETDQQTLLASVKSVIMRTLSTHRGHVTSYIRQAAREIRHSGEESPILLRDWYKHVNNFRNGRFEEADEVVKRAWITFVDNILGKLCLEWKDEIVKSNQLLSNIVSGSDEAFAMLKSSKDMENWLSDERSSRGRKKKYELQHANKEDDNNKDDEMTVEGSNNVTMREYLKEVEEYYDLYESIQAKRKTYDEGLSWENGYKDAVTITEAHVPTLLSVDATRSVNSLDGGTEQDSHHGGGTGRNITFESSLNF